MPRQNNSSLHQNQEKKNCGYCKTRKRVLSSSSSSSSLVEKSYRYKKVIIVRKMAGSKSPMQKLMNFENGVKCKGKDGFSARKLGASLWEINGLHSPKGINQETFYERRERVKNFDGDLDQIPLSPFNEKSDGSKVRSHRRRSSASSHKNQITEHIAEGFDSVGKASSVEVGSYVPGDNNSSIKSRLKDVNSILIASKELVKVLFRILSQEEQQSSKLTLVSALRLELERARLNVDQLIQEQRFSSSQMDALLKQFSEEKASWKSREKERIREAVFSLAREVEMEKKLRRQAERLNKKLGTELAETRAHFSKAVKEIDSERRAREVLEKTCDIEVEVLRKESEKVKQEAEKERQMLQLADILREERVQMKLAEARYEYEEKNIALESLKTELETYLKHGESKENGDGSSHFDGKKELSDNLNKTELGLVQIGEKEPSEGEVDDGEDEEDSCDSELHSIELNMDNKNRSYKWSFASDGTNQSEVFKGRKSLSEKIQWENICLQRKTSDGIQWDFPTNKQGNVNGFDKGRSSEICANGGDNNYEEDDFKRYNKVVKSQRLPSFQESASPAISTGRSSSRLREACSAILHDLAVRRDKIEGQFGGNKR